MTSFPTDLRYTADHEWLRPAGSAWRVGITQFAVDQLGRSHRARRDDDVRRLAVDPARPRDVLRNRLAQHRPAGGFYLRGNALLQSRRIDQRQAICA